MPPQGGQGALLEVTDGNYQRMSAVCPWWDSVRARKLARRV
jgi:hypothetical protein